MSLSSRSNDTVLSDSFAFLDFKSPAEATAALTHRGNRFFLNRKLILQVRPTYSSTADIVTLLISQYASESATNRSGGKSRPRLPARDRDDSAVEADKAIAKAALADQPTSEPSEKKESRREAREPRETKDTRGKKWEAAGRKAPGAALAAAKREKVGIVEATGSKIVFD